jgi:hypothetical protein
VTGPPRRPASSPGSWARRVAGLVVGVGLLVFAVVDPATRPAGAQEAGTTTTTAPTTTTTPTGGGSSPDVASRAEPLSITAVSPWVASDGQFQVRFAPSTAVPAGAELTYTIHQSLTTSRSGTLRDRVNEAIEGTAGPNLRAPVTEPLTAYGDPAAGAVLTIPVRSTGGDRARALLPNPGIHPVELVLTAEDGPELWRQTVFLNRLPVGYTASDPDAATPVAVSLIAPVETYPTLTPDGTPAFSIEQRAELDAAAELLRAAPQAPIRWAVRPNTLDGLARTGERWAEQFLDALAAATDPFAGGAAAAGEPTAAALLTLPYVHVDTAGLVEADASDELGQQVALGAAVGEETVGVRGSAAAWTLDETVTTESLPALGALGVDTLVTAAAVLRLPSNVTEQQAMTGGLELEGGSGVRAIAYDMDLSQRLSDRSVAPGLRAHEIVSLMMATWYDSSTNANLGRPPVSVILVPPTIDPAVVTALTPSLDGTGPVRADTSEPVLPPAASSGSSAPTAGLVRREVPNERPAVRATTETARQIAAYRSMVGPDSERAAVWDRLNAESLATELTASQRLTLHDSIRGQIATEVALIQPPPARSVQVTGRDAVIPLRIRNESDQEVRLLLRARSPRLQIEGGDSREIVLEPGQNRIDLPVAVQAPGESLLRVELLTPDDGIQIASLDVPVRSTAISGVGAALSILSIAFLLGWWIHTHRRKRREESRAAGGHPCQGQPPAAAVAATAAATPTDDTTTDDTTTDAPAVDPDGAPGPDDGPGDPDRSTADGASTDSVTGGG